MDKNSVGGGEIFPSTVKRVRNMAHLTHNLPRGITEINIEKLVACTDKSAREKLLSAYDLKAFAKIFEDGEMMRTVGAFFRSGLNVSSAARELYMHRNTLTYRLNVLKERTGLDLRNFDMAVAFKIIYALYRA